MKILILTFLFTSLFYLNGFSQSNLPITFRVEKQAMSTPMSSLDEIFFMNYYYAKPINIKFDGSLLKMNFDNGATFVSKNVTEVDRNIEFEENKKTMETILYTDINNASDTISLVIDYNVGYVQIVLPTKNSKDEYVGYTSYRHFVNFNEIALK